MSRIRADKFVNNGANGAPQLTFGAEVVAGVGLTGAGGINITGIVTAASASFSGNLSVGGVLTYEDVTNVDSVGIVTARSGIEFGASGVGGTITATGQAEFAGVCTAASFSGSFDGSTASFSGNVSIADSIFHTGDTDTSIRFPAADTFTVETAGSEAVRVDSSGRLVIGSSGRTAGDVNAQLQVEGTSFATSSLNLISNAGASAGNVSHITLAKSRGSADGSNTIVADGDNLGSIQFAGADGTDINSTAALISAAVDGTPGSNDMPGRLMFHTTSDGASSPTERLRIDSSGQLLVGRVAATTQGGGSKIQTNSLSIEVASDVTGAYFNRTDSSAAWVAMRFYAQNSQSGYIQVNTSSVTYATSSDYRIKENVIDISGAIDRVKQLQPKRFNFIREPGTTVDGFLAHEAQTVVPEAVTGTKDEVNDDGDPVMQGIDQSKLVPLLTAALQEAISEIETLKQRLSDAGIA